MDSDLNATNPRLLADLMLAARQTDFSWNPEELSQIWQHQLAVSLQAITRDAPTEERGAAELHSRHDSSWTLKDLLHDPDPPIALLDSAKHYAKSQRSAATDPVMKQVATAMYFGCIAAALVRKQQRLTSLPHSETHDGLRWLRDQQWLDSATKALAAEAVNCAAEEHTEEDG